MSDSYSQLGEPFPFPKEFLLSTRVRQGIKNVKLLMTPATQGRLNKQNVCATCKESGEYDKRVTDVWRKDAVISLYLYVLILWPVRLS